MALSAVRIPAREPSAHPPLLVLLHGLASDENDLAGLASELNPRLEIVSLRAPYETTYGGYAWFGIEFYADGSRSMDEAQAVSSQALLAEELSRLREEIKPPKFILGGFSQGAMMAAGAVLAVPPVVDAAWLMSGRSLPSLDPGFGLVQPLPVLCQHGLYDEVIEVAEGRELAQILTARGHRVRYEEYPMGHQISMESLRDANEWFTGVLK